MFKPVFLKHFRQFHFICLKTLGYLFQGFEIREKVTSAKKVSLRDEKEDVDKICFEVQKTFDNAGGKPTRGFSLQHRTFSALKYAQLRLWNHSKGTLKRTKNSKWATLTKSRITPCQILSWLCQHSQLYLSHRCKRWLNSPIEFQKYSWSSLLFKTIFWHW